MNDLSFHDFLIWTTPKIVDSFDNITQKAVRYDNKKTRKYLILNKADNRNSTCMLLNKVIFVCSGDYKWINFSFWQKLLHTILRPILRQHRKLSIRSYYILYWGLCVNWRVLNWQNCGCVMIQLNFHTCSQVLFNVKQRRKRVAIAWGLTHKIKQKNAKQSWKEWCSEIADQTCRKAMCLELHGKVFFIADMN